jgi:hypothetical protein
MNVFVFEYYDPGPGRGLIKRPHGRFSTFFEASSKAIDVIRELESRQPQGEHLVIVGGDLPFMTFLFEEEELTAFISATKQYAIADRKNRGAVILKTDVPGVVETRWAVASAKRYNSLPIKPASRPTSTRKFESQLSSGIANTSSGPDGDLTKNETGIISNWLMDNPIMAMLLAVGLVVFAIWGLNAALDAHRPI